MLPGKVSITFDAWTSKAFDPYLAITAHYIDLSPDSQTWAMKKDLIAFTPIISNHSGQNQAHFIMKSVKQFGLEGKVSIYIYFTIIPALTLSGLNVQLSWATSDIALNNNTTMKILGEQLVSIDPQTGQQSRWYGGSNMCVWYVESLIALNITHIILFSCISHIIHLATKQCINAIYPIHQQTSKAA